jgi:hypothetical protein
MKQGFLRKRVLNLFSEIKVKFLLDDRRILFWHLQQLGTIRTIQY